MAASIESLYKSCLRRFLRNLFVLAFILLAASAASLCIGSTRVPIEQVFASITAFLLRTRIPPEHTWTYRVIVMLRLPRVIAAAVIGASLAVSGVLVQASTRNPLADPFLLGLSSGALATASLLVVLAPFLIASKYALVLAAFVGAMLAYAATAVLCELMGGTAESLVLAGIAVTTFLSGLSYLFIALAEASLRTPMFALLLGSLAATTWSEVSLLLLSAVPGFLVALLLYRRLNALMYGDEYSDQLGYDSKAARRAATLAAAWLTGVSTAVAGIIGFVGLVVPHIARRLVGSNHLFSIPTSIVCGALVLVLADTVTRCFAIHGFGELPVGVLACLIGAPFFAYIMVRMRRGTL